MIKKNSCPNTEKKNLSSDRHFRHCLNQKLSKWQIRVQAVANILFKWWHFNFCEREQIQKYHPCFVSIAPAEAKQYQAVSLHTGTYVGTVICVSRLTIIGLDNGLSPGRRQTIITTNDGNIINWALGNKLQWNRNQNLYIFIIENAFENVVLSTPQCGMRHQHLMGWNVLFRWASYIFPHLPHSYIAIITMSMASSTRSVHEISIFLPQFTHILTC